MAEERFVLSNFGVRYFLETFVDSNTVPAAGSVEIKDVLGCSLGSISKDTKTYKTLNSGGWDSVVALGQAQDDASFECIRGGNGDYFTGNSGGTTYTMIKDWFMKSTALGGIAAPKCVVEVLPRGNNVYEGVCYYVIPSKWTPGKRDTEAGQEYNFDIKPFGAPIPVIVTHNNETDVFTFVKATGTVFASSVTVSGAGGATTITVDGGTLQMSASVLPSGASQDVDWSVVSGTGTALISTGGLLTAVSDGTVTATAKAKDGSGVVGTLVVTLSNQT